MIIARIAAFVRAVVEVIRDARAMQREMHRKHRGITE
jgi:hypothetical protein